MPRTQSKESPKQPQTDPPLDQSGAAVMKLIRNAKYVTHEQINSVLPSQEVNSEQIEDVLQGGINVMEPVQAEEPKEESDGEPEADGELVEVARAVPTKTETKEPAERTDDPVRMYLREMGSIELLSREGEIAIAKRIEAGREAMISGLCESPLTFRAIIIWRDELNEGKVFLRDIIDLEATYAGPDAKGMASPVAIGPDGQPIVTAPVTGAAAGAAGLPPQTGAPATAPAGARPFKAADDDDGDVEKKPEGAPEPDSTKRTWRARSRSPRSSPSSSPRWSQPSTPSPAPTGGCAAYRTRISIFSLRACRSLPRKSASTRSSRTRSSPR